MAIACRITLASAARRVHGPATAASRRKWFYRNHPSRIGSAAAHAGGGPPGSTRRASPRDGPHSERAVAAVLLRGDAARANRRVVGRASEAAARAPRRPLVCMHHPRTASRVSLARLRRRSASTRPGLLTRAGHRARLDLCVSSMVGDKLSDVAAGQAAGAAGVPCSPDTVAGSGAATAGNEIKPDHVADDLFDAVNWSMDWCGPRSRTRGADVFPGCGDSRTRSRRLPRQALAVVGDSSADEYSTASPRVSRARRPS